MTSWDVPVPSVVLLFSGFCVPDRVRVLSEFQKRDGDREDEVRSRDTPISEGPDGVGTGEGSRIRLDPRDYVSRVGSVGGR